MSAAQTCVLALGSNLGNRLANLQDLLRRLAPEVAIERVSPLYESDPVGPEGQPPYFNATCLGHTELAPLELLAHVKQIEWALGRRPGPRWGPRPADIDILLLDYITLDTERLTIPHPRMEDRAFVLRPLADLRPGLRLPSGRTAREAAKLVGTTGLRRLAGRDWPQVRSVGVPGARPAIPSAWPQ